jgi:hypothetical protein
MGVYLHPLPGCMEISRHYRRSNLLGISGNHKTPPQAERHKMDARNMSMDEYGNPLEPVCTWRPESIEPDLCDTGCWITECGHAFYFTEGGPTQHEFKKCPYCGKLLEEGKLI